MLVRTFHEKDIYPNSALLEKEGGFYVRRTGKAILFDEAGNIALVERDTHPYALLPGGGIDEGETFEQGILRECLEETGCVVELGEKIGIVDDFRLRDMKHVVTHCYAARVVGEKGEPRLTDDEKATGLRVVWMPFEEACSRVSAQLEDLRAGKVKFYNTGFNIHRDLLFLQAYKHGGVFKS